MSNVHSETNMTTYIENHTIHTKKVRYTQLRNKSNTLRITTSSTMYDKECLERYGPMTCILFEMKDSSNIFYETRYLNNLCDEKKLINKDVFYELIPYLLSEKYTVVVVEEVDNKHEITAIHKPTGDFFSILNFY